MLPKARTDGTSSGSFLKVGHIKRKGKTTIVLQGDARAQDGTFGPQIVVSVLLGKKKLSWSFGQHGGNHLRLEKRFSLNPKKWKGPISVEVKEFNGNPYIAVVD